MSNDKNNDKENRGYQPHHVNGNFGYQPKQGGGSASISNSDSASKNTTTPPKGTKGKDA